MKAPIQLSRWGSFYLEKNAKPGMFRLNMALKKYFLTYSSKFIFLVTRFVPENSVIVVVDISEKRPFTVESIYAIT